MKKNIAIISTKERRFEKEAKALKKNLEKRKKQQAELENLKINAQQPRTKNNGQD